MSHPPHVLHVVVSLAPGGLERLVVDWTNARNATHPGSTAVCCLDRSGELASLLPPDTVRVLKARRSRRPFDIPCVLRLARLMKAMRRADDDTHDLVVHSHNLAAWQYATLAARLARVPHVHTEHGTNPHYKGIVNRLRNRVLARWTDSVVAVSRATAEALSTQQRLDPDALQVIPNGVDVNRCGILSREAAREKLDLPVDRAVIGCVGRLASVKGPDRLLQAFVTVRRKQPCTLLFIGGGPMRKHLEEVVAARGLTADVRFAGFRDDAAECLKALDLLVLPSRSEGLPIALLEGMAAGVPVLATTVGEVLEVLQEGQAGGLLTDHEAAWPDAIATSLDADVTRVASARRRVIEHYSQDSTLAAYESVYRELVKPTGEEEPPMTGDERR